MRLKKCEILTDSDNTACSLVWTWLGFVTFFKMYFAGIMIFQEVVL